MAVVKGTVFETFSKKYYATTHLNSCTDINWLVYFQQCKK